jgi:mannose-6-phosphate isomerase-like protein (cupin superfamily)
MIHEDNRRVLFDFSQGLWKSLKVVYVKDETPIGNHYHKNKDEVFFLAMGEFRELRLGETTQYNIEAPYVVHVPAGTFHKFVCDPGSIIFGGASELFDPTDEISK